MNEYGKKQWNKTTIKDENKNEESLFPFSFFIPQKPFFNIACGFWYKFIFIGFTVLLFKSCSKEWEENILFDFHIDSLLNLFCGNWRMRIYLSLKRLKCGIGFYVEMLKYGNLVKRSKHFKCFLLLWIWSVFESFWEDHFQAFLKALKKFKS